MKTRADKGKPTRICFTLMNWRCFAFDRLVSCLALLILQESVIGLFTISVRNQKVIQVTIKISKAHRDVIGVVSSYLTAYQ
jgi:hypothetical protein